MDKQTLSLNYIRRITDNYSLTLQEAQELYGDNFIIVDNDEQS